MYIDQIWRIYFVITEIKLYYFASYQIYYFSACFVNQVYVWYKHTGGTLSSGMSFYTMEDTNTHNKHTHNKHTHTQ